MDGVTAISTTVGSTAGKSFDVAKKTGTDIIQLKFYKNPVFIAFTIYTIFIVSSYSSMSEDTKNRYVFANKFRQKNGDIFWKYLLTYPYDPSKSVSSMVYSIITPPIMWYLFFFTIFFSYIIDIYQVNYKAYFYSIMTSYMFLLIIFTIHMIIFNFIVKPKDVDLEIVLGDQTKVDKSYESFYRAQWVLLFMLSPIYVCIVVYIMKKI